MKKCVWFNPMYIQLPCDKCKRWVAVICANCNGKICRTCHSSPSLWDRLKMALAKKAYGL